ncbi:MAG TPA: FAD-dependent thymidylate synthase [Candidatus Kapabacteria bacterium]|nr:FAD-dependent thymidylate synthase [Candidatus Kapabacteria bacterium]
MTTPLVDQQRFLSPAPRVRLEKAFDTPFKNVVATARTCYSGKGIVSDDVVQLEIFPESRDTQIVRGIYEAGHHTTFQHAQFQFTLDNVSRHFLWSFLHQHPFYNSEQVSQRYVTVKPGMVAVPPMEGAALELYTATVEYQHASYKELIALLSEPTAAAYYRRFPYRAKYPEKYAKDVRKKAQEIARYVLPVGTFAYLYHTISGLTLLRYWRLSEMFDTPLEQRIVIGEMVREMLRHDPNYRIVLEDPIALEETPEYRMFMEYHGAAAPSGAFADRFDAGLLGYTSRLVDYKVNAEAVLAESVREVLGLLPEQMNDDDAIELALNPAQNTILGQNLTLTTHAKITRALHHPHYTFRRKLSHTADSQDQRHRMTPGSRPILAAQLSDDPDFITPEIITHSGVVHAKYVEVMERSWDAVARLKRMGVPAEFAHYLLPNAVSVRFTESSDLLNLHHKHKMRLCYNAQEEIWRASVDEARQVRDVHPRIGRWLLPPCSVRSLAGTRPICPEGERFCGEKVWKIDISRYERII